MYTSSDASEPILMQDPAVGLRQRFVLKKEGPLWDFYKRCEKTEWTADEVPLNEERLHMSKLTPAEQHVIKVILAFFAAADGIVNENLMTNFAAEVTLPEARCFYAFQARMECVHQETYTNLLNVYVPDTAENATLMNALETLPVVKKKAEWALRWIGTRTACQPIGQRLLAFACVEGIHFASSFATIYWFKQANKAPGLAVANEWIARDETTHWQFAALLFQFVQAKPTEAVAHAIVAEAVKLEMEFVAYVLQTPLIGLNVELMQQYVRSVANLILQQFGYADMYTAHNPFPFMKMLELPSYSNFFEKKATDYQKSTLHAGTVMDFRHIAEMDF
jgi:ribonucleoside-diphosphate reductase beta chain